MIIGKHNTDVLSTTAVNDLVMIVYYDPCYTHRSSRSKEGFSSEMFDIDLVVLSVATVNERLLRMCLPTLLFSYLGPEQSRALPMMHALNWHE